MSETADMNERWLHPDAARAMSTEIVDDLKWSIKSFDEPMIWTGADNLTVIEAEPIHFSNEYMEPVPYGKLRSLPDWIIEETMNWWMVQRNTIRPTDGTILREVFLIHPGRALGYFALSSSEVMVEGSQGEFARNALQDELLRARKEPHHATQRDYANIMNAVYDLSPLADQKDREFNDYLKKMTNEDKRNYRSMQRNSITTSEVDKTARPKWWGIEADGELWLVKASSNEEAILDLEDHFNTGVHQLDITCRRSTG